MEFPYVLVERMSSWLFLLQFTEYSFMQWYYSVRNFATTTVSNVEFMLIFLFFVNLLLLVEG